MGVHPSEDSKIRHPPSSLHPFSSREGPSRGKVGEEDPAHCPPPPAVAERPERKASITRWFATLGRAVGGHRTRLGPWKHGGTVPLGDTRIVARKRGRLAENELTLGCKLCFFLASQCLLKDSEFPHASKFWEGWGVGMGERGVCGERRKMISSTFYFFPGF